MKRRRFLIDDSIHPVFVTTTIVEWVPVFSDNAIAVNSLRLFENIRLELNLKVLAFVLLPDHFHGILKSQYKGDLSTLMQKWKSTSARIIREKCHIAYPTWLDQFSTSALKYKCEARQNFQIWMPRFDDFAIRDERQYKIKLNYIHGNPIKRGLVENPEDYPYSSAMDYLGKSNGLIKVECGQSKL